MSQINAKQLSDKLHSGADVNILDVREAIEFHTYNIGGKNIPVNKLQDSIKGLGYNKNDEIIVICSAGIRSETAQAILHDNGFNNVINLKGGLLALQKLNQQKDLP